VTYKTPVLTADQMAEFVAASPYKDYRIKCIALFREIHGDEYADAVKNKVLVIFNGRNKNGKRQRG